ncbi:MAG: SGNH/GDSL hydrolase family protein [Oscillospiraceae bacterium]
MNRLRITAALSAILLFTGCEKISETPPELNYIYDNKVTSAEESVTSAVISESTSEDTSVSETETTVTETVSESEVTSTGDGPSTEWDPAFYDDCLFFGDSICRALSVYNDLVDPERVAAVGGGAARNLNDFTFKLHDIDYTVTTAAEAYQPDMAFLWMGVNDINITDKETYTANLEGLAREINEVSPESRIIIIGMTPTASYHEWGANATIIEYNAAAEEMVSSSQLPMYYIDVGDVVSDENGYLLTECDGGDGMHLTQLAYYRILSKINTEFKDIIQD